MPGRKLAASSARDMYAADRFAWGITTLQLTSAELTRGLSSISLKFGNPDACKQPSTQENSVQPAMHPAASVAAEDGSRRAQASRHAASEQPTAQYGNGARSTM